MNDLVCRLQRAYRRELDLYSRVELVGREGIEAIRRGQPLQALNELNLEKQRYLNEIAAVEMSIAEDKDAWRRTDRTAISCADLEELLDRLRTAIETILSLEQETERRILEGAGSLETQEAVS